MNEQDVMEHKSESENLIQKFRKLNRFDQDFLFAFLLVEGLRVEYEQATNGKTA